MSRRKRDVLLSAWVSAEEYDVIKRRMEEAGTMNMSAFIRKLTLNGFVIHVDLSPVKELVSLQRRCSNNLNQVAIHANTHGVDKSELSGLQKDYAALWEPLSDLLKQLAEIVKI